MQWVKATERLPKEAGANHMVIVKALSFVTFGFKNHDENEPKMHYYYMDKTFLNNDVDWLDESEPSFTIKNMLELCELTQTWVDKSLYGVDFEAKKLEYFKSEFGIDLNKK